MKVDQKRLEKFITQLQNCTCPLCGNNNWGFNDRIFQLMEFESGSIKLGGTVFPVIPLTCTKCGNTYFINALVADLIDKPVPQNSKDAGEVK